MERRVTYEEAGSGFMPPQDDELDAIQHQIDIWVNAYNRRVEELFNEFRNS